MTELLVHVHLHNLSFTFSQRWMRWIS